ncbi:AGAP006196-PA [Anopheles gambiae str. PEST]|uniref:AGAP006196-PA n=1 Tax=Anopheles gambiae TaxID=7165 RepID=Q7Q5U9_ANOGA|nr:AGAP006196-PA [Anopheles gambiae str. PEST]
MIAPLPVVMFVVIGLLHVGAGHSNDFDAIKGCKQYNTEMGYNDPLEYIPTSSLNNTVDHGEFKYYKIGVQGTTYGFIRLSNHVYPYDQELSEIVLGSNNNTRSSARTQYRNSANEYKNTDLARVMTPNLLSPFRPVMLKLKVWVNGKKEVFHDGEHYPFLSYVDTTKVVPLYMAFTKVIDNLVFFYDCPM